MKQLQLLQLLQLFVVSVANTDRYEISKMFENDLFAFFAPFCPIDSIFHSRPFLANSFQRPPESRPTITAQIAG
jgi:hypothetical protein